MELWILFLFFEKTQTKLGEVRRLELKVYYLTL